MKKLLVVLVFVLMALPMSSIYAQNDGQWASLVQPGADGSFHIRNHAPHPIWVINRDGTPRGVPIPAGGVSASSWDWDGDIEANQFAYCRAHPEDNFQLPPIIFGSDFGRNTSILFFPCSVIVGASQPPPQSPPQSSPASSGNGTPCVTPNGSSNMNIRRDPTTDAPIVGNLPANGCIPYVGAATTGGEAWYEVVMPSGLHGFVYAGFSHIENGTTATTTTTTGGSTQSAGAGCLNYVDLGDGFIVVTDNLPPQAIFQPAKLKQVWQFIGSEIRGNRRSGVTVVYFFFGQAEGRRFSSAWGSDTVGISLMVNWDGCQLNPSNGGGNAAGVLVRRGAQSGHPFGGVAGTFGVFGHEAAHDWGADHGDMSSVSSAYYWYASSAEDIGVADGAAAGQCWRSPDVDTCNALNALLYQ